MSENLKFPVFDESVPPPKALSMNHYFRFVQQNLKWFGYSEKQRQQDIQEYVEVPFRL